MIESSFGGSTHDGEPSLLVDDVSLDGPSFVAQMRPALVRYFKRKTRNAAEADDLAQDVLLRVLVHAAWVSTEQAKGYVFRAAVNRWNDHCRRQKSHAPLARWEDAGEHQLPAAGTPEELLGRHQELTLLVDALAQLSPRTSTVLVLVKLENMRIAQVADALDISVSAVNKHLARGLAHLSRLRHLQEARS